MKIEVRHNRDTMQYEADALLVNNIKFHTASESLENLFKELFKIADSFKPWLEINKNQEISKQIKKPEIGLFGNEVQNIIHRDMMNTIYERLSRLELLTGIKA